MADEYINRAKFCEYLRTRKAESADDYGRGWKNGIIATEKAARGFPAADVVPVIHAHWAQTSSLRLCSTRSTDLPMTTIAKSRSWKYISSTGTSGMFS